MSNTATGLIAVLGIGMLIQRVVDYGVPQYWFVPIIIAFGICVLCGKEQPRD